MTRFLLVASALAVALAVNTAPARAFTLDGQSANTSDGTPRFADPDQAAERMADPSSSGSNSVSGSGPVFSFGPARQARPYASAPMMVIPPVPPAARLGSGGFNSNTRYH